MKKQSYLLQGRESGMVEARLTTIEERKGAFFKSEILSYLEGNSPSLFFTLDGNGVGMLSVGNREIKVNISELNDLRLLLEGTHRTNEHLFEKYRLLACPLVRSRK